MPISGRVRSQTIRATIAAMPEIVRDAMGDAVRTTASETVRDAKARVPVESGILRDHIDFSFTAATVRAKVGITLGTTVIGGVKAKGIIIAGRNGSALKSAGARKVSPTHYAHLVEFGHGGPHGAPPHPFMGPAFRGQQSAFDDRMRRAQKNTLVDLTNVGSRFL